MKLLQLARNSVSDLVKDLSLIVNGRSWRWLTLWSNSSAWVVISYRSDRFLFVVFGSAYGGVRPIVCPIFLLFAMFGGRHEIHYQAKIGSGLKILHPSLGVVVSKWATVGTNLTLTGGNVIGGRQRLCEGLLNFGDNVYLGANAVVLGPVNIGSFVNVGAGSVVLKDVMSRMTVAGVPARPLGEPS